jgi:hypothetical protein
MPTQEYVADHLQGGRLMPVILGTGAYRYEVVDEWAKLPLVH